MRFPSGGRLVVAAILALIGIDQLSKSWVQNSLALNSTVEIVPNLVRVTFYINRGAVGGIGWHSPLTIPFLIGGSAALIALLVILYRQYSRLIAPSWRINLFLALAITPLLSHALDRLRQGYVVDFLQLANSPIFNFADVLPQLAIGLLAIETASWLRRSRGVARRRLLLEPSE